MGMVHCMYKHAVFEPDHTMHAWTRPCHWNLIMPAILSIARPNHVLLGASLSSLSRSSKYVGWLLGLSMLPLSWYCHGWVVRNRTGPVGRGVPRERE
jgi:hypothetical protein